MIVPASRIRFTGFNYDVGTEDLPDVSAKVLQFQDPTSGLLLELAFTPADFAAFADRMAKMVSHVPAAAPEFVVIGNGRPQ